MSILDLILLVPLAYGIIRGFFLGFLKELASIVGVFIGIFVAKMFGTDFAEFIQANSSWSSQLAQPVAYVTLFLLVAILMNVAAWLLMKLLTAANLGWANKLAGGLFGGLKYALILSLLLNCFVRINDFTHWVGQESLEQSVLYTPIQGIIPTILPTIQEHFFETK